MENSKQYIDELKAEVLRCFGEEPRTSAGFENLSSAIEQKTGSRLSAYTLKRLFGYVKNDGSPAINTLSILSRYVGYTSWANFVAKRHPSIKSNAVTSQKHRPRYLVGIVPAMVILLGVGLLLILKGNSRTNPHEITGKMMSEDGVQTWTINKDTWALTITGEGRMRDFTDIKQSEAWLTYRDSLRSVTIDEGITYLGDYAFSICQSLTDVNLPMSLKAIGNGTFNRCTSLVSLVLPEGLESLGAGAFRECTHLQEIVVPSGITELMSELFALCYSLRSCTLLGSVTYMDRYVFGDCHSLRHIELPSSLTMIGSYDFSDCRSLEEVVLPEGLTFISEKAFRRCTSLKRVVLPSTLNIIGTGAFSDCDHLEVIECHARRAPQLAEDVFCEVPPTVKLICPQGADYNTLRKAIIQH